MHTVPTDLQPFSISLEGHDHVDLLMEPVHRQIKGCLRRHFLFHFAFLLLFLSEFFLFFSFFAYFFERSLLAFGIAGIFFTLFSYVLLRLYMLSRKGAQLQQIKEKFLVHCQEWLKEEEESIDHHIILANLCTKLSLQLQRKELYLFRPPGWLSALQSSFQRFGAWWAGMDYHCIRELFLREAVERHIFIVKKEPTNLEAHANLANAYVTLSALYSLPQEEDDENWIPRGEVQAEWEEKFRLTAEKAVEELKILNDYAPNDPWVHAQLAYSYHDLQMPLEEIREYETIYRLRPEDRQTLFRLGILYFQQGFNAKGLRVYEEIRRSDPKKAEALIKYYGACDMGNRKTF